MELFEYIKSQLPNPNPAIMYELGATDALVNYVLYTPENTNLAMLGSIGEVTTADCNHPELGTLIYCGSASNKTIVDLYEYDEGVQEGFEDPELWKIIMYGVIESQDERFDVMGVFDGNIVSAESLSEKAIRFGTYLEIQGEDDDETGDPSIIVSELQGASHYAIYTNPDPRINH